MIIQWMNMLNKLCIIQWITKYWLNPSVVWEEKRAASCEETVLEWPEFLSVQHDTFLKAAKELPVNSCGAFCMYALSVRLSIYVSNSH